MNFVIYVNTEKKKTFVEKVAKTVLFVLRVSAAIVTLLSNESKRQEK